MFGAGLPTPPRRATEGLLGTALGTGPRGDLRSGQWHGRETVPQPSGREMPGTIPRGKTRRGDELRERQFITDPVFPCRGG